MGKWANLSPQPNLTSILRYGIATPIILPWNTQLNLIHWRRLDPRFGGTR